MPSSHSSRLGDRLCSMFSNANNEDPGGSVSSWKRCVIIELSRPWEHEVAKSIHFPPMVSAVLDRAERRGLETKLQCVTPDPEYSVEGYSRVMYFSRPKSPFATHRKDEFVVPKDDISQLLEALIERPEILDRFEHYRVDTLHIRDILVCTHGSHDVCCASLGYPIYHSLRNRHAQQLGGKLRVWQVSHIGGHRFSPNVVDLPEGRYWCRVNQNDIESLIFRNRTVSEFGHSYRGWVGMDSPFEQVAEREILIREGWKWIDLLKSTQIVEIRNDGRQAKVRIGFSNADGSGSGAYEAIVDRHSDIPRINCLTSEVSKEAMQYAVSRLDRII